MHVKTTGQQPIAMGINMKKILITILLLITTNLVIADEQEDYVARCKSMVDYFIAQRGLYSNASSYNYNAMKGTETQIAAYQKILQTAGVNWTSLDYTKQVNWANVK